MFFPKDAHQGDPGKVSFCIFLMLCAAQSRDKTQLQGHLLYQTLLLGEQSMQTSRKQVTSTLLDRAFGIFLLTFSYFPERLSSGQKMILITQDRIPAGQLQSRVGIDHKSIQVATSRHLAQCVCAPSEANQHRFPFKKLQVSSKWVLGLWVRFLVPTQEIFQKVVWFPTFQHSRLPKKNYCSSLSWGYPPSPQTAPPAS